MRQDFLRRGWHTAGAALVAGLLGLASALAVVQVALRVVIAHSNAYFDVLVAKYLAPDFAGNVGGLVAGSGVPVRWHMAPFSGHITAPWVLEQRSELLVIGAGPLVGTAVMGWVVASVAYRLALPKWPLLTASVAFYAAFVGAVQVAASSTGAPAGMELSTSMAAAVAAAAGWAFTVGGVVVRFHPAGGKRAAEDARVARERAVRGMAVTAAVAVVASVVSVGTAAATSAGASTQLPKWRASGVKEAVQALEREGGRKATVADNPRTGTPSMLAGLHSRLPKKDVPAWLHAHSKVFGVDDTNGMLTQTTGRVQMPDSTGAKHVWYDQAVNGVPVYGARLGVHLDHGGTTVTAVSNGLRPDLILPASTTPKLSKKNAIAVAGKTLQGAKTRGTPALVVYAGAPQRGVKTSAHLTWQVDLEDKSGFAERVFVDALQKGTIAGVTPLTETALNRAVANLNHAETYPSETVVARAEGGPESDDDDVNLAYDQSGVVYNYYKDTFGRDSIDGNGFRLLSYVHFGRGYENAYWNGQYMTYGDGMLSQDVSGHEITHGITEKTAGLQYSFQSGALNESLSDFFGEMTELKAKGKNDWLMGSDMKISGGPFRNMKDPHSGRRWQPQTMSEYQVTCMDNGGVHINSGIPNYALYRMAYLLGVEPAQRIAYRALTQYLTPTSNFANAATAMQTAAADIYGKDSIDNDVTRTVWSQNVGITPDTPDTRPSGCSSTCSTLTSLTANAGALRVDGAPLDDVVGSLIHMYELGTIAESPAVAYYDELYLENRDDFEYSLELSGPLMDQFVKTVQAWVPVFDAVKTDQADKVHVSQTQIDLANQLADLAVAAAKHDGKTKLADLITRERGRIDAQHVVGLSVKEGLDYLDSVAEQVPPVTPGQAAPSLASTFDNTSITQDSATSPGDFDGNGASFSSQALAATGVTPGSTIAHGGVALTWPSTAGTSKPDNTVANGQTIALSGSGDTLGFLVSASYGPSGGKGTVFYSDGSTQGYRLSSPDWFAGDAEVAISTAYQNRQENQKYEGSAYVYYVGVPLQEGKTPISVQLPDVSNTAAPETPALHVYAMSLGKGANELTSTFNNVAVTQDTSTDIGDFDGGVASYSAQALSVAGATAGSTVTHAGLDFTWPSTAGKTDTWGSDIFAEPDNVVASGQTIAVDGTRGSTLGFLVSASYGPAGGKGTVRYSDGTSQQFDLNSPDWFGGDGDVAISTAYQNRQGNQRYEGSAYVYYVSVPLQAGKTPVSVQLPNVSAAAASDTPSLHVFAMTRG